MPQPLLGKREKFKKIREEAQKRIAKTGYLKTPDYGRERCYQVEHDVKIYHADLVKNMTLDELKREIEKIFNDSRVKQLDPFPGEQVIVENCSTNGAYAYYFERIIRFGAMKDNFTMCHEAAHILCATLPGHNENWQRVYCQLLSWFVSEKAAFSMEQHFKYFGTLI